MLSKGSIVYAQAIISDPDSPRPVARPGDRGEVEYIDSEGIPCVRWERTGWATDCDPADLEVAS